MLLFDLGRNRAELPGGEHNSAEWRAVLRNSGEMGAGIPLTGRTKRYFTRHPDALRANPAAVPDLYEAIF